MHKQIEYGKKTLDNIAIVYQQYKEGLISEIEKDIKIATKIYDIHDLISNLQFQLLSSEMFHKLDRKMDAALHLTAEEMRWYPGRIYVIPADEYEKLGMDAALHLAAHD